MRVDLHVHTRERSHCGKSEEEALIQAALARGLDGLAFTDHSRLAPPGHLEDLNRRYAPFRFFNGIEISVLEREDVLVLGLDDPVLETNHWSYQELLQFVRKRGGFIAIAHPFRYHDTIEVDIERYPPDGMEVCSKNIDAGHEPRIRAIVERLNLRPLCNSDAHDAQHVGIYYNQLQRAPRDDRELVEALKRGRYLCSGLGDRVESLNRAIGEPVTAEVASSVQSVRASLS